MSATLRLAPRARAINSLQPLVVSWAAAPTLQQRGTPSETPTPPGSSLVLPHFPFSVQLACRLFCWRAIYLFIYFASTNQSGGEGNKSPRPPARGKVLYQGPQGEFRVVCSSRGHGHLGLEVAYLPVQ